MPRAEAMDLLRDAPSVSIATTTQTGEPIFREMNAAIVDGRITFHGAAVGEKTLALGREAVVSATETIASLPSYFVDPERACPATTLYRSVQVHGVLEAIEEGALKATVLTALMNKHQPEGGFVPLDHTHPLYAKEIASLLVFGVSLDKLDGKSKLAQNRKPLERVRIMEGLWRRGNQGDLRAIELVMHACDDTPVPEFLRAPAALSLCVQPSIADAEEVAELLAGTYWNDRFSREEIADAHVASSAWVIARDLDGRPVASARAISDGSKRAWIYDVISVPAWRGKYAADAVMRLLLDHPAVRKTRLVHLGTRDAQGFYARMGFENTSELPARPYRTTEMCLRR